MKRLLTLLTVLCLLPLWTLAEVKVSGINEYPIVGEKIELTAWSVLNATTEDYATNEAVLAFEELTNVRINWIVVGSEGATMKTLSLASGDYPDMYLTSFNNTSELYTYGQAGVLIPLNGLIEEYSYHIKGALEERPYIRENITAPDGNIYSLFRCWEEPNENIYSKMFVFTPWLEKAGLSVPTTLEEFRQMLIFFRDNDMNGNGDPNDEIPLMGTYQYASSGSDPMYFLMEAFQLFPASNFILADQAGNLSFQANTPEFRDGLRYVNGLYAEKLLAEETYIQDLAQYRATVNVTNPEDMVVGTAAAPYYQRFVTQSIYSRAYQDFDVIPPLKNYYDGETQQTTQHRTGLFQMMSAITSACDYPEVAIKWLDYWVSEAGSMSTDKYGVEGVDWMWTDDYPAIDGTTPSIIMTATNENSGNNRLLTMQSVPTLIRRELFLKTAVDPDSQGRTYPDYTAHVAYEPFAVFQGLPSVTWCNDDDLVAEYSELKKLIEDHVKAAYTQFILGTRDIESDNDWNAYLNELESLGLTRYLELAKVYFFGA